MDSNLLVGMEPARATTPDGDPTVTQNLDVDPQILEALKGKDRIYVLKLGETFEALIQERRGRVELTPTTSYQRLLVHRCSAYYRLAPESDPATKGLFVHHTLESRIPERRICELVPVELPTQPAFKIMRRSAPDRRSKPQSHGGSVAGEDADLSDVEPSEAGSLGGRSNFTNSSSKKRMTIEEREAAYNEARSRIFGFEEKEKGKDKDMSASSSSLSISGSTSTSAGGRSSLGDTDDASSPATESEWSTPSGSNSRDRKDGGRRGGSTSASSTRSLRNGGSFHGNGSGSSSRNSRAPSPAFTFATLYEPPPSGQVYDPSQHHNQNVGYHPNHFAYPYSPPSQGPSPPFLAPYPYYPQHPYPYQSPPPMQQHNPADPSTPSGHEPYSPHQQMNYAPPYGWTPHPNQPPVQSPSHNMHMNLPPQQQQQQQPQPQQQQQQLNGPPHQMGGSMPPPPPPPHSPPYPPYGMHPGHAYTYPMNPYYPQHPPPPLAHAHTQPAPQGHPPLPQHPNMQQQPHPGYDPRSMNGHGQPMSDGHFNINNNNHNNNGPRNGLGNGVIPPNSNPNHNQNNGRSVSGRGPGGPNLHPNVNNGNGSTGNLHGPKNRIQQQQQQAPPSAARSPWSFGPGIGMGGFTTPANTGMHTGGGGGDVVGPRLNAGNANNTSRRTSGNTSSGGNSRSSSNCDEVSSTASSSTTSSSNSRRTFTSTTSSQHPLPPRPDWAVGLKAQPTLAAMSSSNSSSSSIRHHSDHNSRTMSPMSPPRSNGQNLPGHGHISPRQLSSSSSPGSALSSVLATMPVQHQNHSILPAPLKAMDFPPLTTAEKRTPVVTGAWGASRPVLSPTTNGNVTAGSPNPNTNGNTNIGSPSGGVSPSLKGEDATERLGIPQAKAVRRPGPGSVLPPSQGLQRKGDVLALASMSLGEEDGSVPAPPTTTMSPPAAVAAPLST